MKLYATYVGDKTVAELTDLYVGPTTGGIISHLQEPNELANFFEDLARTIKKNPRLATTRTELITYDSDGNIVDIPYVFATNSDGKELRLEIAYGKAIVRGGRLNQEQFASNNPAKNIVSALKRFAKIIRGA